MIGLEAICPYKDLFNAVHRTIVKANKYRIAFLFIAWMVGMMEY
jgi:hypothetical protein